MNKNIYAAEAATTVGRRPYVAPASVMVEIDGDASLMTVSNGTGWTTTDRAHGNSIIDEDADNPYSDDDF